MGKGAGLSWAKQRGAALLLGLCTLLLASAAHALVAPESCFNDTDCSDQACGGAVCDWNQPSPLPVGDKQYTCVPAGTKAKGMDGWCTGPTNVNCKCRGLGAQCVGVYCTFTLPSDAPAGVGGGSSSSGGAGSAGGAPASAGRSTAGTSATPGPQAPVGQGDTDEGKARTAQACHVSNVGRESPVACWTLLGGLAAILAARSRKRARIPE